MPDIPLEDRVTAPVVRMPHDTDELSWRPATLDDVDAVLDCARAMDPVDHPHYVSTREEFEDDFSHSHIDMSRDSLLALDPSGRVVAWGLSALSPGQDTLVRSILFGGVRPDSRGEGIGRQLFAWQNDRGLEQLAGLEKTLPGWLMTYAEEKQGSAASLYSRFGYRIARYYLQLTRVVGEPIADRTLGEGLRIVQFDETWSEATMVARNNAFRDHWGSQPVNEEIWSSFIGRSHARADLSYLAVGTSAAGVDEVAGFVITSVNEDDWEAAGYSSGYIDLVGVTREWRGRGIAPALLSQTLRAIRDAGLERAVLDVDSDSPTGALGLYTGVGFTEESRSLNFIREF